MTREELLQIAKPILFNMEMVRAILEDRKTATRRLVKPKSKNACGFYVTFRKSDNAFMGVYDYDENERQFDNSQTPPACVGDILYVRETWSYHKDAKKPWYGYKANGDYRDVDLKWHPSIHMPKEAARIFLRVTDVRVERLQEITDEEAEKEGCNDYSSTACGFCYIWDSTIRKSDLALYGWNTNPWVWVIEFERVKVEE